MNGNVVLTGDVLAPEEHRVIQRVRKVWGVRNVTSQLNTHKPGDSIPALQGSGRILGTRGRLGKTLWAPSTRAAASIIGATLVATGLRQRTIRGYAFALGGIGLLARSITNQELRKVIGLAADPKVIDIHKSITVQASPEALFDFWRSFENFPIFMSNLKEVRDLGDGRSHWTARGPGGIAIGWNARITREDRPYLISWSSEPGAPIANTGTVRFMSNAEGGTTVDVSMWYNPPLGRVGHTFVKAIGDDPKRMMDQDLLRLKSLLENGKTTVDGTVAIATPPMNQGFATQ
jgi:uncharacterized membrane protein